MAERSRFLDLRALAALEHMRFTTRHRLEGAYTGRHRSLQQGGAGEFVDFREYVGGEDLRRLDWKVLARSERAYVRLYQDETNLVCTLLVDASGSMRFPAAAGARGPAGAGSKLEYVQYLATALTHVISRQQDQVGLGIVDRGLRRFEPPGSTLGHVTRLQEIIEQLVPEPRTDLAGALRDLFQRLRRRGVLLILSDFLVDELDPVFAALRLFRHSFWEVVLVHIIHPDEERLPDGLAYRFEGLEEEGTVDCSPADIRAAYQERFAAHVAQVRTMALAAGCDYRRVSTAASYLHTLGEFLVERSG
ncbi:MAG: DUF58 domain-containing protein [Planctomycetota bacterium]